MQIIINNNYSDIGDDEEINLDKILSPACVG